MCVCVQTEIIKLTLLHPPGSEQAVAGIVPRCLLLDRHEQEPDVGIPMPRARMCVCASFNISTQLSSGTLDRKMQLGGNGPARGAFNRNAKMLR